MNENSEAIEVLRKENYHFRTLEQSHLQLEESLESLNRRKVLTPEEEIKKKTYQKAKLAAKDTMREIVRNYCDTGQTP